MTDREQELEAQRESLVWWGEKAERERLRADDLEAQLREAQREGDEWKRLAQGKLTHDEIEAFLIAAPKEAGFAHALQLRMPEVRETLMRLKAERDALAGQVAALRDALRPFAAANYVERPQIADYRHAHEALTNTTATARALEERIQEKLLAEIEAYGATGRMIADSVRTRRRAGEKGSR